MTSNAKKSKTNTGFGDLHTITFTTRPWDMDIFKELNNGRGITLFDLGRFDLFIRTGFSKHAKRNKWALPVAGSTIRYRSTLRGIKRVTMKSRPIGHKDQWFYLEQALFHRDKCLQHIILRGCVRTESGTIMPGEVFETMGITQDQLPTELPPWVLEWANHDAKRIWPPII